MRTKILQAIIADRARVIPLVTGGIIWLLVRLAGSAGLPFSVAEQNGLALFLAMALGWVLDGWALAASSEGTKALQVSLRQSDPTLEVDGLPGPQTIAVTQDVVASAVTAEPKP
jgi:hypothetical protein